MRNVLINPTNLVSIGKILFADVHTAQQTESVKFGLRQKNTIIINVPSGKSRIHNLKMSA